MKYSTRDQTPEELKETLHIQHERLCDACANFDKDARSPLGLPNMAVPIRALACKGQGNDIIKRVCEQHNIPPPVVRVSEKPNEGIEYSICVGSVPAEITCENSGEVVTLETFMARNCLVFDAEHERIIIAPEAFIKGISEKRGFIHSDRTIPAYFDHLNTLKIYNSDLVDFLFINTAAAVSYCAHDVLLKLGISNCSPAAPFEGKNRLRGSYFAVKGVPWATETQAVYQKKLNEAEKLRRRGKPQLAKHIAESVIKECINYKSLYYKRAVEAAKFEIALDLLRMNQRQAGQNMLADIWVRNEKSEDPYLKTLSEKAFFEYNIFPKP